MARHRFFLAVRDAADQPCNRGIVKSCICDKGHACTCDAAAMKTLAIISQKGGAGKTTLALHLAAAWSLAGSNAAVLDLDPQASAVKWSHRRTADLPVVMHSPASLLDYEMKRIARSGGEVLVLDTAPRLDSAALEAAKASDLAVVPCRPSILDLEAVASTLDLVRTTGKPVVAVLNAAEARGSEAAEAAEAVAALGATVCPARLARRVAFAQSLVAGLTAQEMEPGGKAAREIEQVHKFICERMNL